MAWCEDESFDGFLYTPSSEVRFKGYESGKALRVDWLDVYTNPEPTTLYVVLDWKEVSIAHADGERVFRRYTNESCVAGKHNKGGMSQQRMERNHAIAVKAWFRKIEEVVWDIVQKHPTTRIVVGGPGMTKDQWVKGLVRTDVARLVDPGTYCTGYTDEYQGIRELVSYSMPR